MVRPLWSVFMKKKRPPGGYRWLRPNRMSADDPKQFRVALLRWPERRPVPIVTFEKSERAVTIESESIHN